MSNFTIPVGPLHVALEEPMYFRIDVSGETVKHVDIHAGHVHRGIEYLVTKRNIFQNIVLTERICSLCSNSHPQAYAMAVEQIAGLTVPPRAEYLRRLEHALTLPTLPWTRFGPLTGAELLAEHDAVAAGRGVLRLA